MKLTEKIKQRIIMGAVAAVVVAGSYGIYRTGSLRNQVERAADKDNNSITSVEEWESVYDSLGKEAPIDLAKKLERCYDPVLKEMPHPADNLSIKEMKRYLVNNQ